jgi:hypothetical protein
MQTYDQRLFKTEDHYIRILRTLLKEFKDKFPGEEPFIKLLCMRKSQANYESRSDQSLNWRQSVINKDMKVIAAHDYKRDDMEEGLRTVKSTFRTIKNPREHDTYEYGNKAAKGSLEETNREFQTLTDCHDLKPVDGEGLILESPLTSQHLYMRKTKAMIMLDEIKAANPIPDIILMKANKYPEIYEKICTKLDEIQDDMYEEIKTLIPSGKTSIAGKSIDNNEIAQRYLKLQRTLNEVKISITPITKHIEDWNGWVKEYGFTKSLELLIHELWEDAMNNPENNDDDDIDD